jgi:hypothetical protein
MFKVARIMDGLSPQDRRLLLKAMEQHCSTTAVEKSHHRGSDPPHHSGSENPTAVMGNAGDPTPSSFLVSESLTEKQFPEELQEIPVFLRKISAPREFDDAAYWTRIHAWLGGNSGVGYLDELAAYLAWNAVQNGARKHRDVQRGFRNWLAKSAYYSEQKAQRDAVRRRHR